MREVAAAWAAQWDGELAGPAGRMAYEFVEIGAEYAAEHIGTVTSAVLRPRQSGVGADVWAIDARPMDGSTVLSVAVIQSQTTMLEDGESSPTETDRRRAAERATFVHCRLNAVGPDMLLTRAVGRVHWAVVSFYWGVVVDRDSGDVRDAADSPWCLAWAAPSPEAQRVVGALVTELGSTVGR